MTCYYQLYTLNFLFSSFFTQTAIYMSFYLPTYARTSHNILSPTKGGGGKEEETLVDDRFAYYLKPFLASSFAGLTSFFLVLPLLLQHFSIMSYQK
mgnify:CR=1 FL=1